MKRPDGLRRAGVLRLHELPDDREKLLVFVIFIEKVFGAGGDSPPKKYEL
jgi:hypothetical protein